MIYDIFIRTEQKIGIGTKYYLLVSQHPAYNMAVIDVPVIITYDSPLAHVLDLNGSRMSVTTYKSYFQWSCLTL